MLFRSITPTNTMYTASAHNFTGSIGTSGQLEVYNNITAGGSIRTNHGNSEAGGFSARNPNDLNNHVSLNFNANAARIRVGGSANSNFVIQGASNNARATFAPSETVIHNTLSCTHTIQAPTIASTGNGWVQMSPSNNALHFDATNGQCRVRRINNVVEVQWDLTATSGAISGLQSNSAVTMFTLPVGYRPTHWFRTIHTPIGQSGSNPLDSHYQCIVNTGGAVQFNRANFGISVGNGQGGGTRFQGNAIFTLF